MIERKHFMSKFQVIIEKNGHNNAYSGVLFSSKYRINFNPLTILATLNYNDKPSNIDDLYFDDWDYEYEYGFGTKIKIQNREQYYKLVLAIRQLIKESIDSHTILDLSNIEVLRIYFDITNTFIASRSQPLKFKFPVTETTAIELPIKNATNVNVNFHYSNFSLESALSEDLSNFQTYIYEGNSLADVVFSILHFQTSTGLKYKKCLHCNSLFATSTDKIKYCNQKSPHPQYSHLNCEQAVRNISQQIKRKYKQIYNNLTQNHPDESAKLNTFLDTYNIASSDFHQHPTPENADAVFRILNKKNWY